MRTCFSLLDVHDLPVASMPTIDPNSNYQGNTYAVLDEPAGAAGGHLMINVLIKVDF